VEVPEEEMALQVVVRHYDLGIHKVAEDNKQVGVDSAVSSGASVVMVVAAPAQLRNGKRMGCHSSQALITFSQVTSALAISA
jgi:hypothetical protein